MRQFRVVRLLWATALLMSCSLSAQAVERNLTLVNETDFAINAFYAANVSRGEWGDNRIDGEPLAAGASVRLDLDDGTGFCFFNLRAVFDDGDEVITERVNICDAGRFYYRP